jgi:hypothetical protein
MIEIEKQVHKKFQTLFVRPNAATGGIGPFTLPPDFDREKSASAFKEEGAEVIAAGQDQPLDGLPLSAPGWVVWKNKKGEIHKVVSGGKTYILMHRPIETQQEVNSAFSELSKSRVQNREALADSAASANNQPRSKILSEKDLDRLKIK